MKKLFAILTTMLLAGAVFADGVSQYENQSAEYGRTLNRNASIGVDAAYYNPAGTAFMPNGMYVMAGTDIIVQNITVSGVDGTNFGSTSKLDLERNSFVPYFARAMFVYKQDQMAVSVAVVPFAGGGMTIEGDTANTFGKMGFLQDPAGYSAFITALGGGATPAQFWAGADPGLKEISALTLHAGPQVNFAYAINEMFSVGVGARYARLMGSMEQSYKDSTKDTKEEYSGDVFGGVFSVDVMPMKALNIAAKFEYWAKYDKTTAYTDPSDTTKKDSVVEDMIPPKFGLGIAYNILPELKTEVSFNYYLNSMVEYDADGESSTKDYKLSDNYDDGMEFGIAFEYMVMPELAVSLGYLYTDLGAKKDVVDAYDIQNNDINFQSIAAGASYKAMEGLTVDVGVVYELYDSAVNKTYATNFDTKGVKEYDQEKSQYVISIGVTYAIDGGMPTSLEEAEAMKEDAEGQLEGAQEDAEAKADDIDPR